MYFGIFDDNPSLEELDKYLQRKCFKLRSQSNTYISWTSLLNKDSIDLNILDTCVIIYSSNEITKTIKINNISEALDSIDALLNT